MRPDPCCQSAGSMHCGPSCAALFTQRLTGRMLMASDGQGSSATSSPSSQGANASSGRMTGMRW